MTLSSIKTPFLVVLGAVLVVISADLLLQRLAPIPPRIIEVDDGVAAYEAGDPDTLVLGSSHTRSFVPVRDTLAQESSGRVSLALVPVEWGTFASYNWVLQHRLRPLMEERQGNGLRRRRLSRAILVTTFYDLCAREFIGSAPNLPARAWTLPDFLSDAGHNGITDFNRNYLQTRWKRLFPGSVLVQDRGYDRIFAALLSRARPLSPAEQEEKRKGRVEAARVHMEDQAAYCQDARERQSLEEMIDYFLHREVEVTVVLFPLMPGIVSDKSRATTLRTYREYVTELGGRRPIRIEDMTLDSPLRDEDFQLDMDHVNLAGNRIFAAWALSGHLAFLRTPRTPPSGGSVVMGGQGR